MSDDGDLGLNENVPDINRNLDDSMMDEDSNEFFDLNLDANDMDHNNPSFALDMDDSDTSNQIPLSNDHIHEDFYAEDNQDNASPGSLVSKQEAPGTNKNQIEESTLPSNENGNQSLTSSPGNNETPAQAFGNTESQADNNSAENESEQHSDKNLETDKSQGDQHESIEATAPEKNKPSEENESENSSNTNGMDEDGVSTNNAHAEHGSEKKPDNALSPGTSTDEKKHENESVGFSMPSMDEPNNDKESPQKTTATHEDDEDIDESRRNVPRIADDDPEIKSEPTKPAAETYPSDEEAEGLLDSNENQTRLGPVLDSNDKTRVRQTHAIIIPSYASWFNMKKIHHIERDSLPEFFTSSHPSKSPKIYANYRNFMINAYRLNPNEYLTLTSCRRNLVGDVGTLMRVHRFLTKWGLINYQVNPLFKPAYALEKLPNESLLGLPYTGDFHVQYDTPRGLFPFDTYKVSPENINTEKLKTLLDASSHNGNSNMQAHDAIPEEDNKPSIDEPATKKPKIADDWTTVELANLLIGIKDHKNDWYKIAKKVGNGKTPQDCIIKFLGLPIEDRFNQLSEKDLGIIKYAPNFPISSTENPVIGNLIFMTNLVDSDVVKAALSRASKIVDDQLYAKVKEVYGKKADEEQKSPSEDKGDSIEDDNIDDELKGAFNAGHKDENSIKEAAAGVLGAVGARSHLFANYEERELQQLTTSILDREMTKLDVKMNKVNELEKIFQREKQNLARLQNEVFVDRLSLTKSTVSITKKLQEAVSLLKARIPDTKAGANEDTSDNDLSNISSLVDEVQHLLYKPSRQSLTETKDISVADNPTEEKETQAVAEAAAKPVSVEAPQLFKVWAP